LTGGTDTHLLQMDLRGGEWSGKAAEERLHEVKITANRNTVPFDERPPMEASGVRLGTPAVTMRGFDEDDMREVGAIIAGALEGGAEVATLAGRSHPLCERRPLLPRFQRAPGGEPRFPPRAPFLSGEEPPGFPAPLPLPHRPGGGR